jgi:predicted PurR-regulated permease PerM
VVEDLWTGGRTLLSVLSLLVITPVIAFYLLIDWERMSRAIDDALPRRHAPTIRRLLAEMDRSVGGFIHGQFIVGVILGTYYATALLAVGLDKALLIGIFAGIVSFIPYLGSTSGFLVSVGVAAGQFWPDWPWILVVAAVFLFGWFVEGNVLQPRLVGNRTGLHPVVLMFALVAFGSLFGFAGLLVGVPAAAAIGVLVRFAMSRYRASRLYLDEGDESATVRAGGGDGGDADAATPAERPSQEESR